MTSKFLRVLLALRLRSRFPHWPKPAAPPHRRVPLRRPLLHSAAPATTGPSTGTKVGAINIEEAIFGSNEGRRDLQALQKKFEPKQNELKSQNDELEGLKKQLTTQQDKLNEEALATLKKQIESKQKVFDRSVQDAQEDFGNQQQEIATRILQKMAPMIVKYSQENGFGMIIDTSKPWPQSNVLWWGEAIDITKAVVDIYNAQSGVAAPAAAAAASQPLPSRPALRSPPRPSRPRHLNNDPPDTSGVGKVPAGRVKTRPFFFAQASPARVAWCPYQQTDFTLEDTMFAESMLETSWAQRARRSWTTLTSFGLQALIIGCLLLLPLWKTIGLPAARTVSTPISLGRVAVETTRPRPRSGRILGTAVQCILPVSVLTAGHDSQPSSRIGGDDHRRHLR